MKNVSKKTRKWLDGAEYRSLLVSLAQALETAANIAEDERADLNPADAVTGNEQNEAAYLQAAAKLVRDLLPGELGYTVDFEDWTAWGAAELDKALRPKAVAVCDD